MLVETNEIWICGFTDSALHEYEWNSLVTLLLSSEYSDLQRNNLYTQKEDAVGKIMFIMLTE